MTVIVASLTSESHTGGSCAPFEAGADVSSRCVGVTNSVAATGLSSGNILGNFAFAAFASVTKSHTGSRSGSS